MDQRPEPGGDRNIMAQLEAMIHVDEENKQLQEECRRLHETIEHVRREERGKCAALQHQFDHQGLELDESKGMVNRLKKELLDGQQRRIDAELGLHGSSLVEEIELLRLQHDTHKLDLKVGLVPLHTQVLHLACVTKEELGRREAQLSMVQREMAEVRHDAREAHSLVEALQHEVHELDMMHSGSIAHHEGEIERITVEHSKSVMQLREAISELEYTRKLESSEAAVLVSSCQDELHKTTELLHTAEALAADLTKVGNGYCACTA